MTIKELIAELQKYDENVTVKVFDSDAGNIDILEVYEHDSVQYGSLQGIPKQVHYVCIV